MTKKNIILGLTGSIATVMVLKLIDELEKNDFNVKIITTKNSWLLLMSVFVRYPKQIFQFLKIWDSGYSEVVGAFSKKKGKVHHINLVKWADAILIAPASANTISKITHAIADNFLTTTVLAMPAHKKVFIAPAMNEHMWHNVFFQKNIEAIKKEPLYQIIGPETGLLQCGDKGIGKMTEVKDIVRTIKEIIK